MKAETLFDAIKEAGIPYSNHESDLYFPVTEESRAILMRFAESKANATTFTNQVHRGLWYDIPFAYQPYWDAKQV